MGCDTYLIRKQNLLRSEPRTYIWKETILWDGRGSDIADFLTDCELRRCVEPDELLGEVQGLLNPEKLFCDHAWNKEQLSLLAEVLFKEIKTNGRDMDYELLVSY